MSLISFATAGGATPLTTSAIDTTGATLLVVNIGYAQDTTVAVTDSKGNSWIALSEHSSVGIAQRLFYAWNPVVGTSHTFTVSGAGAVPSFEVGAYSGVVTTSNPLDAEQGGSMPNVTQTGVGGVALTPTTANNLAVVGVGLSSIESGFAAQNGFSLVAHRVFIGGSHEGSALLHLEQATASPVLPNTVVANWTTGVNMGVGSAIFRKTGSGGGGGSATITSNVADGRIFKHTGNTWSSSSTGSVVESGAYANFTPNQVRLVQEGTSTALAGFDWTAISSATGGNFAHTFANVPQGVGTGWYNVQFRDSAVPGTIVSTGKRGIGIHIGHFGQSQSTNQFDNFPVVGGALAPTGMARIHGGQVGSGTSWIWAALDPAKNSAIIAADILLSGLTGGKIPIAFLNMGYAGTSLVRGGPNGNWLPLTGSLYQYGKALIAGLEGSVDVMVDIRGESDSNNGTVTQAEFYVGLNTLYAQTRADCGNANLPIVQVLMGRTSSGYWTDAAGESIKNAQVQKYGDANIYRVESFDGPLHSDGLHRNTTGCEMVARRWARAIGFILGLSAGYRGPHLTTVVRNTPTTYTANLAHGIGADFTPTTGITGFTAYDGASAATITSVVRDSSSAVLITLAAAPAALPTFKYLYGTAPDVSAPLLDNSALALPLEYNSGVTATAGTGDTTAPIISAPTAAATGPNSATGTVSTNEANGNIYCLASANATESGPTIKASGTVQAVTATGVQAVSVSSLLASTLYYLHYLHRDAAGNDSNVVNSASFTTSTLPGFVLPQFADAVRETVASISGSTLTLNGAVPQGFRTFSAAFAASTAGIPVRIEEASTANWVLADVTLTSTTQLTVTRIYAGSNGSNMPTFGAGAKSAFCVLPASQIVRRDWIDGNAYGIDPTFTNDCTAGVQQAILDAYALGVGVIRYATGHYKIAGALVTNVGGYNPNSQIYIPQTREGAPNKTIIIEGLSPPNFEAQILRNVPPPTNGVVFESTIMGTGIRPAVFGMVPGNSGDTTGWQFNYTNVGFASLGVRVNVTGGANPMNALNLMEANQVVKLDMVRLDINMGLLDSPNPVSVGSAGLIGPRRYNHLLFNGGCIYISGFTTGIVAFEHMCFGNVTIIGVINLISLESSDHASYIGLLSGEGFTNGIVQNGNHGLAIGQMDFEHLTISGSWFQFQKDVKWISGNRPLTVLQCTVVVSNVGVSDAAFVKDANAVVKIVSGAGAN